MRIFYQKIMYFLLPVIALAAFPFWAFYASGEFVSAKKILDAQLGDKPVIVGKVLPLWGEEYSKIEMLKRKKPDVITLGNSRVLQIRSAFFKNNDFYNGGGIGNLTGFRESLEKLGEDEKPKIILVGLEQSYFHPFSDDNEIPDLAFENKNDQPLLHLAYAWRKVYFHIFSGEYSLSQFFRSRDDGTQRIGLQAHMKNAGTRNDGSYEYGDAPERYDKKNEDYQFKDTRRRMEKGVNLLYQGDHISEKSIALLTDFLEYANSRDIYVIGFLPPYAQEIYDEMKSSGKYQYIFHLEETLRPIFEKYDYGFFDFSDMSSFGAEKDEIVDGLHASEKAYVRLFIAMTKKNRLLNEYASDQHSLELMLENNDTAD